MASHFTKYSGLVKNVVNKETSKFPQKYMKQMIVREHKDNLENLHPAAKQKWEQMTQPPLPLKFKLHEM